MSVWHVCGTPGVRGLVWATMPVGLPCCDQRFSVGAGEGNRTLMTSLEGWGSAIELRPRSDHARRYRTEAATPVAYRLGAPALVTALSAAVTMGWTAPDIPR